MQRSSAFVDGQAAVHGRDGGVGATIVAAGARREALWAALVAALVAAPVAVLVRALRAALSRLQIETKTNRNPNEGAGWCANVLPN